MTTSDKIPDFKFLPKESTLLDTAHFMLTKEDAERYLPMLLSGKDASQAQAELIMQTASTRLFRPVQEVADFIPIFPKVVKGKEDSEDEDEEEEEDEDRDEHKEDDATGELSIDTEEKDQDEKEEKPVTKSGMAFVIAARVDVPASAELLRKCVASVRANHPESDVIVVDNMSPFDLSDVTKEATKVIRNTDWNNGHGFEYGGVRAFVQQHDTLMTAPETFPYQEVVFLQHTSEVIQPIPTLGSSEGFRALFFFPWSPMSEKEHNWVVRSASELDSVFNAKLTEWERHHMSAVFGPMWMMGAQTLRRWTRMGLFNTKVTVKADEMATERLTGLIASCEGYSPDTHNLDGFIIHYPSTDHSVTNADLVQRGFHIRKTWGSWQFKV
jgi:hypothetical protein